MPNKEMLCPWHREKSLWQVLECIYVFFILAWNFYSEDFFIQLLLVRRENFTQPKLKTDLPSLSSPAQGRSTSHMIQLNQLPQCKIQSRRHPWMHIALQTCANSLPQHRACTLFLGPLITPGWSATWSLTRPLSGRNSHPWKWKLSKTFSAGSIDIACPLPDSFFSLPVLLTEPSTVSELWPRNPLPLALLPRVSLCLC